MPGAVPATQGERNEEDEYILSRTSLECLVRIDGGFALLRRYTPREKHAPAISSNPTFPGCCFCKCALHLYNIPAVALFRLAGCDQKTSSLRHMELWKLTNWPWGCGGCAARGVGRSPHPRPRLVAESEAASSTNHSGAKGEGTN